MFNTEDGLPICKIDGGKLDGEIIFVVKKGESSKYNLKKAKMYNGFSSHDGIFQQVPNDYHRIGYIAGPAGSGKSTKAAEYALLFQKLYPDSKIIMFSRVDDDTAFIDVKLKRVVLSEDLAENPLDIEEVEPGSLVIFDDVDAIVNQKLRKSVYGLQMQIMEIGRHKNIKCLITQHLINGNDKKHTRTIMNEMDYVTLFPESCGFHQIEYFLKNYFGFKKHQIEKFMNTDSRWITLFKKVPQMMLTQTDIFLIKDFQ